MPEKYSSKPLYSPAFSDAIVWAFEKHAHHYRKGTEIPYVAHLLAVTAKVLEARGSETEAIAAVLHDVVEDTDATEEEVRARCGAEVARIVAACTSAGEDDEDDEDDEWKKRKRAYINHLKTADESALIVSMADKNHNISAILADYRSVGEELWDRFSGGREGTLWYYTELAKVIRSRASGRLEALGNSFGRKVDKLIEVTALS